MTLQELASTGHPDVDPPLILIVEDEWDLCDSVRWILEDEGLKVETASDGREAIERAAEFRPTLILLDMSLPILNGEQVAEELRKIYPDPPPIVVMSAAGTIVERSRRIGAVGWIAKPFDLESLVYVVKGALATA